MIVVALLIYSKQSNMLKNRNGHTSICVVGSHDMCHPFLPNGLARQITFTVYPCEKGDHKGVCV